MLLSWDMYNWSVPSALKAYIDQILRVNLITVRTREQVAFCKEVLFAFRTNLDETTYVNLIMDMITNQAFKLVYIANENNTRDEA